jgi:hypothetical protein
MKLLEKEAETGEFEEGDPDFKAIVSDLREEAAKVPDPR